MSVVWVCVPGSVERSTVRLTASVYFLSTCVRLRLWVCICLSAHFLVRPFAELRPLGVFTCAFSAHARMHRGHSANTGVSSAFSSSCWVVGAWFGGSLEDKQDTL